MAAAAAAVAVAEANAAAASAAAAVVASSNGNEDRECFTLVQWEEFFKFQRGRDSPDQARNCLLVIAVLITTATYQAVLSPPGGLWQDTKTIKETGVIQEAGKSILATNSTYGYGVFLISNTAGFCCSLFMIEILTKGFPLRLELWFVIFALTFSYDSAMISIIPNGWVNTLFTILSLCMPFVIAIVAHVVRKLRILSHRLRGGHSRVSTTLQVMESSGP